MAPEVTQVHDEPFQELAWPPPQAGALMAIVPDEVMGLGPAVRPLPAKTEVTVPEPPPPVASQVTLPFTSITLMALPGGQLPLILDWMADVLTDIVPDEVIGFGERVIPMPWEMDVTVPEPPPPPEGQEVMQLEAIQKPMLDLMWPMTSSFCEGEAVPMPTLPTGTPKPREPAKPPLFTMRAPCFIWLPVPTLIGSGALLDGGAPVGGFQAARDMPIEAMATVDIAAIKYFFMVLYLNCTLLLALP